MYLITTAFGYLFGIPLLLLILFLVLAGPVTGKEKYLKPVIKFLARAILLQFGIRVRARGLYNTKIPGPCIFMANHVNIFDPFILFGYIPQSIRGVELDEHFSWPVWGAIVRALGNIPISHKNPKMALASLERAAEKIRQGISIAIMPEGSRTRDGLLQAFRRGSFLLAKRAGVGIMPMAMKGLWEVKTVHSLIVRPGRVELVFGRLISPDEVASNTEKELKEKTRKAILDLLENQA